MQNSWGLDEQAATKAAMRIPKLHDMLTSEVYEECRHVGALDPDIANKRSWSMAAKIVFQRQRNVEHSLKRRLDGLNAMPYNRIRKLLEEAVGWRPFQR